MDEFNMDENIVVNPDKLRYIKLKLEVLAVENQELLDLYKTLKYYDDVNYNKFPYKRILPYGLNIFDTLSLVNTLGNDRRSNIDDLNDHYVHIIEHGHDNIENIREILRDISEQEINKKEQVEPPISSPQRPIMPMYIPSFSSPITGVIPMYPLPNLSGIPMTSVYPQPQKIISPKSVYFNKEKFYQLLDKLESDLSKFISDVNEYLNKENIQVGYSLFFNKNNPNVWAFFNHIKPTPGTFKLFQVNTEEENNEYYKNAKDDFFSRPGWNITISKESYSIDKYRNLLHGAPGHYHGPLNRYGDYNINKDPGFRRYAGWNTDILRKALTEAGVFDYQKEKYGRKNAYKYPKLKELGLENPCTLHSATRETFFPENIPKYALEMIYTKSLDITPNWEEILNIQVKTGNLKVLTEAIRKLAKQEFGVTIQGDLPELKVRIQSIIRNKELSSDISGITEEFLLYPGTKENPRVQYIKHMTDPSKFKVPKVDIEKYFTEVTALCNDPSKSKEDAVRVAQEMDLGGFLTLNQSKEEICQVIQNYLDVIRNERIL